MLTLATEVKVKEELSDQGVLIGGSLLEGSVELFNASLVLLGASHLKALSHEVSEAQVPISLSLEVV